ncbi:glycosyltransferase family 2 protein [Flavobacteriaceae bacterium XHP0103]|uniref:glycosyltransferase family 2 protein n=1 Tax=Marixanthotalea marina TaxID=2844359 RepID=UPI002989AEF8|nr:glycosyltransferase family 2 protein [Marixanthotalea marina]MBU3822737.1 glycosyltransferase family 2 protein [Marixanthotalea marina]
MKTLAILMPTYNAAPYLVESISSILNQTFSDFDFYIYDDCSTDNTAALISGYKDPRLHYIKNDKNLGIAQTLNKGLDALLPNYRYIARMDADDWAYPMRLEKQMSYLQQHKAVAMCGTQGYWVKDMALNPESGWTYPTRHEYISYYLLFTATFGHSSLIISSAFFNKNKLRYDETIKTCEDWDLWIRVVKLGKAVNLPDFLMKYRILNESNHRALETKNQHLKERSKLISGYWLHFGAVLTPKQIFDFYYGEKPLTKAGFIKQSHLLIQAFNHIYQLAHNDLSQNELDAFSYMLARRLLSYWRRSKVSRKDFSIWWYLVKEVTFRHPFKLVKSMLR